MTEKYNITGVVDASEIYDYVYELAYSETDLDVFYSKLEEAARELEERYAAELSYYHGDTDSSNYVEDGFYDPYSNHSYAVYSACAYDV